MEVGLLTCGCRVCSTLLATRRKLEDIRTKTPEETLHTTRLYNLFQWRTKIDVEKQRRRWRMTSPNNMSSWRSRSITTSLPHKPLRRTQFQRSFVINMSLFLLDWTLIYLRSYTDPSNFHFSPDNQGNGLGDGYTYWWHIWNCFQYKVVKTTWNRLPGTSKWY